MDLGSLIALLKLAQDAEIAVPKRDLYAKKMDEASGQSTIKAITKDNPIMGLVAEMLMKRSGLQGLIKSPNSDEIGVKQPQKPTKLGLK
jgi:hypothetical protein